MRHEKWISIFAGTILAFGAAAGSAGCLVTGMSLDAVGMTAVVITCAVTAAVFSLALGSRLGLPALLLAILGTAWLWHAGPLEASLELLVREISYIYHSAYGMPVLRWSDGTLAGADMTCALCVLGSVIALSVAFTVVRRRLLGLGTIMTALPVLLCLVVIDTVPTVGFLFLTVLVLALLLITWQVRQQSEHQGNVTLGLLCFPVALALGLLFLLNPQADYDRQDGAERLEQWVLQLLEQKEPEPSKPTASSQPTHITQTEVSAVSDRQVDLETIGPRKDAAGVALMVRAQQTGTVYLRGCSYTVYDGRQWHTAQVSFSGDAWFPAARGTKPMTLSLQTLLACDFYYTTYSPEELPIFSHGSIENPDREKSYKITYLPPLSSLSGWESVAVDPASRPDAYLQLPEETAVAARTYLEQKLGKLKEYPSAGHMWQTADAITALVRQSAVYDMDTAFMPDSREDFAMWFLEESDTGYCVHFATAATVLLRAAGIPARYVTGYLADVQADQLVPVPASSAHAWVECWIDGAGWMLLEPTPAVEQTEPEVTIPTEEPPQTETAPVQSTGESEPDVTVSTLPTQPKEDPVPPPMVDAPPAEESNRSANFWWLLVPGVLGVLVAQWQLRLWRRKKRRRQPDANTCALILWQELSQLSRLLRSTPDKALYLLAQKAKFSQHTLTQQELEQLRQAVADCQAQLRKRHIGWQLVYCLIFAIY